MSKILKILIISCVSLICLTKAEIISQWEVQGKREEVLSDNYKVEWEVNSDEETIQFAVSVKTTGFVGFGLSLTGSMIGADIVIGGVTLNGETYFKDYHGGIQNGWPTEDKIQNWELLEGTENGGETFLRFKRKLDTCDENKEDIPITNGTVKIIWSIGATDNLAYHDNNRGALAVNMLDPPLPPLDLSGFRQANFTKKVTLTSDKDTIYWCTIFKRTSTKESHIVAFKPKFDTPEALKYTHHFNMYTCTAPDGEDPVQFFDKYAGDNHPGQDCFKNVPNGVPRHRCQSNLYAWSLGGRVLVFPDDIGFPWGHNENEYFLFEVHLNNPEKLGGVTFETGITIYDTEVFREKEAGMLAIGTGTDPSLIVPPESNDWKVVGHCSSDCTTKYLPTDGINIFNINLHAHLAGRKMRARHFRDGKELPWISNDQSYDSDFQENRPLAENIKFLPGDHISIECSYESKTAILGGPATTDEMCMLFAFYYPKSKLENCFSGPPNENIYEYFGIESVEYDFDGIRDPIIKLPEKWINRAFTDILNNEIDWTSELRTSLQDILLHKDHWDYCLPKNPEKSVLFGVAHTILAESNPASEFHTVNYPKIDKEYEEPPTCTGEVTTTTARTTTTTSTPGTESTTGGNGGTDSTTDFRMTFELVVITLFSVIYLH